MNNNFNLDASQSESIELYVVWHLYSRHHVTFEFCIYIF